MITPNRTTIAVLSALTLATVACANDGTLLTYQTFPTAVTRAADQAILADAIDDGFAKLAVADVRAALGANAAADAYIVIEAPFALDPATLAYIREKAALAAGAVGLRILETRVTLQRPNPERTLEVVQTEYPDTDARVLMLVSYVGVDERSATEGQDTHGTTNPDAILTGRFKGTFAVTPRKASFPAYSQVLEGESSYALGYRAYIDER